MIIIPQLFVGYRPTNHKQHVEISEDGEPRKVPSHFGEAK